MSLSTLREMSVEWTDFALTKLASDDKKLIQKAWTGENSLYRQIFIQDFQATAREKWDACQVQLSDLLKQESQAKETAARKQSQRRAQPAKPRGRKKPKTRVNAELMQEQTVRSLNAIGNVSPRRSIMVRLTRLASSWTCC
jgi:hypothetical protein